MGWGGSAKRGGVRGEDEAEAGAEPEAEEAHVWRRWCGAGVRVRREG